MKNKEFILCHKDHDVLSFSIDNYFRIMDIPKIYNKERIPLGLNSNKLETGQLEEWFSNRSISEKRTNFKDILKYNNARYKKELFFKNNSVSVCDCYWIKTEKENKKWQDVNVYDTLFDFNENIYIGIKEAKERIIKDKEKRRSPNIMSNGNVPKMWIKKKKDLFLIKGSEGFFWQEPINEVIVSDYLDKIGVIHVKYFLDTLKGRPFCVCKNMLNKGEELIPAYYIACLDNNKKTRFTYNSYIKCCENVGIKFDIIKNLDQMFLIDYIIANEDRHWFNFGFIRDAETLRIKGIAPIFDNGLALFAKMYTDDIKEKHSKIEAASFYKYLYDNLRLVNNAELLRNENINTLPSIFNEYHKKYINLDEERIGVITDCISSRIKVVKNKFGLSNTKTPGNIKKSNKLKTNTNR